jgi:outer membrane protein assembly factor BamB
VATSGDGSGARHAVAIRAEGKGQLSDSHLVWEEKRRIFPYVPCVLTHGDYLFSVRDQATGMAQCHQAKTGKLVWEERLGGSVSASPVLIDGKVYVIAEDGNVFVYPAAPKFELLAKNSMGERVIASPAVADGKLFIRGQTHLFCIGKAPAR